MSIDGIELSESEVEMAEDMGLEEQTVEAPISPNYQTQPEQGYYDEDEELYGNLFNQVGLGLGGGK